MKPSEKHLDHLRPLTDAIALEVGAAVEKIGPAVGEAVEHATERGMRTYGAQIYPLLGNGGASLPPAQVIYAGACQLMGWSLVSTAGGSWFNLYDGTSTDGRLLMAVGATATYGADGMWFGPSGLALLEGLYVEPVTAMDVSPVVGAFFINAAGPVR